MNASRGRKPLLEGRGGVLIADFCLSTGLERDTVDELVKGGRLDGAWTEYPDPMRSGTIYHDALPTRDDLVAMGLIVHDDYNPHQLRYGGVQCTTHGWSESVLLTRQRQQTDRDVPHRIFCLECSRAGLPPSDENTLPVT